MTSSLIGALFSQKIETAAINVKSTLEKMFTDDDCIAVYIFCTVVLILFALTMYKVQQFETVAFTKLEDISSHSRSITSERESLSPPSSMNYSATPERVVPRP